MVSVTENRSTDTKLNTNQDHGKIPKLNQLKNMSIGKADVARAGIYCGVDKVARALGFF